MWACLWSGARDAAVLCALAIVLLAMPTHAQDARVEGPFLTAPPHDAASVEIDAVHDKAVAMAYALGIARGLGGPDRPQLDRNALGLLEFPMRLRRAGRGASPAAISNFVDLDATAALKDFACGARTYDGHRGLDIFTTPFSLWKLDNDDVEVIAAAAGTITQKSDGAPDRNCVPLNVSPSPAANYVVVLQDDGAFAYYWHMKAGALTAKGIGERVGKGEKLGVVASSGRSTGPHLHFEMRDEVGATIDPFAGVCGASRTLWKHQWNPTADFKLVQAATHSAVPVFATCNTATNTFTGTDTPNYSDTFTGGQAVRLSITVRDMPANTVLRWQVLDPNGAEMFNYAPTLGTNFFKAALWYATYTLPASPIPGTWRFRASAPATGQVIEHPFFVATSPAQTSLAGAVLPSGRSIRTTSAATVFATIVNGGTQAAEGCWIQPETPLFSSFSFQTTDPGTNALTGTPNSSVRIPAGAAQSFVLSFQPNAAAVAQAVTTSLRFKCTNSDAAPVYEGVNTLLLSFDPNPVPDIIPVAATPSNDGVVRIPGPSGARFWSAASVNIGASAALTVAPQLVGTTAATVTICATNPATAACLAAPSSSVAATFAPNGVHTFSVFVQAIGAIAFDPASNRIRLNFTDGSGVVRGQTSVAVTTN